MNGDFEHNRLLFVKDGNMHFGCINPFCCHGSVGLPNHWEIPLETKSIRIVVLSHSNRILCFEISMKQDVGKHKAGKTVRLTCADNLFACQSIFKNLFAGKETTS